MSFEVKTTPVFEKSAKALSKRHRSFKKDLDELIDLLAESPFQGIELTPGLRKIRMSISSKGRGKSGGARVITYTVLTDVCSGKVYLLDVYDKADHSTVDVVLLRRLIADLP